METPIQHPRRRHQHRHETQLPLRESLALFVSKADEMQAGRFWRYFAETRHEVGCSLSLDQATGLMTGTEYVGPDTEALSALLLPFRMFIQPRDPISFRQLVNGLRRDRSLPSDFRRKAGASLSAVHHGLSEAALENTDAKRVPELVADNRVLSYDAVLNTFLYGNYAHLSPAENARYRQWQQSPRFGFLEFVFVMTVSEVSCQIVNIAHLIRSESIA